MYIRNACLAYPALRKELIAIRELRKEMCTFLTQKLWSDHLCCDQNQVAFVLPTVICAKIANSPPSHTCHYKSSVSFICPPGILLCWFSLAPSPEAQQYCTRTGVVWARSHDPNLLFGVIDVLLKCRVYWWAAGEVRGADPRLVAVSTEPRLSEHGPHKLMEEDNSDHLCCVIDNGEKLRFQYAHALPFLSYYLHIEIFICKCIFKMHRIRMVWVI